MSDKPFRDHTKYDYPKIEIDWEEFDKLCEMQCTQEEIANFFRCSIETIATRLKEKHGVSFPEYFNTIKSVGRVSLRRAMHQKALSGDNTMMIWLSKQHLGMTDKQETKNVNTNIELSKLADLSDNELLEHARELKNTVEELTYEQRLVDREEPRASTDIQGTSETETPSVHEVYET